MFKYASHLLSFSKFTIKITFQIFTIGEGKCPGDTCTYIQKRNGMCEVENTAKAI